MAKKEYSFYPGCSSQSGASSSNMQKSVDTMCEELDIKLNHIPDWNCCSASIGYAGGGELPRLALSARNIALSEQHNTGQDIVATCAACWLSTRETKERLNEDSSLLAEANQALAEAGLVLKNETPVRHMVEVLIEDIGYGTIGEKVIRPLEGSRLPAMSAARPTGRSASPGNPSKTRCTWISWWRPSGRIQSRPTTRRCSAAVVRLPFPSRKIPGDDQGHHRVSL